MTCALWYSLLKGRYWWKVFMARVVGSCCNVVTRRTSLLHAMRRMRGQSAPYSSCICVLAFQPACCDTGSWGGCSSYVLAFLVILPKCCQPDSPSLLPSPSPPLVFSLLMTTMCLEYQPSAVACVCIHLACHWKEIEVRGVCEDTVV